MGVCPAERQREEHQKRSDRHARAECRRKQGDCRTSAPAAWPTGQREAAAGLLVASGANLDFARRLPAQTEVTVAGLHFLQEDSPDEIGRGIAGWMGTLG